MLAKSMRRWVKSSFQICLDSAVPVCIGITSLIFMQGAKYVEYDTHFAECDEKKEAKGLKISLNLNDAACKLKLKNYPEVVDLTTKVNS